MSKLEPLNGLFGEPLSQSMLILAQIGTPELFYVAYSRQTVTVM